jgi:hypothetical protein
LNVGVFINEFDNSLNAGQTILNNFENHFHHFVFGLFGLGLKDCHDDSNNLDTSNQEGSESYTSEVISEKSKD